MLGAISSREDDDFCAVEVSFHDAAQHRRVPLLTDFYHFSMASLSTAVASSGPPKPHMQGRIPQAVAQSLSPGDTLVFHNHTHFP